MCRYFGMKKYIQRWLLHAFISVLNGVTNMTVVIFSCTIIIFRIENLQLYIMRFTNRVKFLLGYCINGQMDCDNICVYKMKL